MSLKIFVMNYRSLSPNKVLIFIQKYIFDELFAKQLIRYISEEKSSMYSNLIFLTSLKGSESNKLKVVRIRVLYFQGLCYLAGQSCWRECYLGGQSRQRGCYSAGLSLQINDS